MRKICALTANRADFSRIEKILEAIKNHKDLELQLVVMGSHLLDIAGQTIDQIEKKGFNVDYRIYMNITGSNPVTMTKSVGLGIIELATALDHLKPDIVIVPGDRFEALSMGITPALMNIHVAHIQGGEVTGTIDESIRHALTKISHLHFVATEKSKDRVIKIGELPENVYNVGCPGTDLLLDTPILNAKETIEILNKEVIMTDEKFNPNKPYLFLVQHPVTTEFGSTDFQIIETMEALKDFNKQIIIIWPNIDAGANAISRVLRNYITNTSNEHKMKIFKHIPSGIFVNVLRNASCQIGNSSIGIRESCYFGTPVVNIGTRQESRERGKNVIDVSYNKDEINKAIKFQLEHGRYEVEKIYGDGTAGQQIAEKLATVKLPNIQKKITL